jgi:hypothetical protein
MLSFDGRRGHPNPSIPRTVARASLPILSTFQRSVGVTAETLVDTIVVRGEILINLSAYPVKGFSGRFGMFPTSPPDEPVYRNLVLHRQALNSATDPRLLRNPL